MSSRHGYLGLTYDAGGETIKDMQNSTGCKINVSTPSGADISREIGLIGTRQAIESAKRAIWDKVGTVVNEPCIVNARDILSQKLPLTTRLAREAGRTTRHAVW